MSQKSRGHSKARVRAGLATLRSAPPPASLVAALLAFLVVFAVSTTVAGGSDGSGLAVEPEGQYPATDRVVVDSGNLPGVGDYQLLTSRDYKGGLCTGLRLKRADSGGGDVLGEGCGGPEDLNIGKMTAGDGSWTVLNGIVPADAASIRVTPADGSAKFELTPVQDDKGVAGKFVVEKIDGEVGALQFDALDAQGEVLESESFR